VLGHWGRVESAGKRCRPVDLYSWSKGGSAGPIEVNSQPKKKTGHIGRRTEQAKNIIREGLKRERLSLKTTKLERRGARRQEVKDRGKLTA